MSTATLRLHWPLAHLDKPEASPETPGVIIVSIESPGKTPGEMKLTFVDEAVVPWLVGICQIYAASTTHENNSVIHVRRKELK